MAQQLRPLLWLSGVDADLAFQERETRRYAGFGVLVGLMAVWSVVIMFLAMRTALHLSFWPAAGFAFLFGLIILCVDRMISGLPLLQDGAFYRFSRILLIRGLFAIILGIVVSHAALLAIYHSDLDFYVSSQVQRNVNEAVAAAGITSKEKQQIADDSSNIVRLAKDATDAQSQLTVLTKAWIADRIGSNGDLPGNGDISKNLGGQVEAQKTVLKTAVTARDQETPKLRADVTSINDAVKKREDAARSQAATSGGYGARSKAVWTLVKQDKTVLLYALFLLAMDLLVTSLKATWPASRVDYAKRIEEGLAKRRQEAYVASTELAEAMVYEAGQRAEVIRAQADRERDAHLDRLASAPATGRWDLLTPPATSGRPRPRYVGVAGALVVAVAIAFGVIALNHGGGPLVTNPAGATGAPAGIAQIGQGVSIKADRLPEGVQAKEAARDLAIPNTFAASKSFDLRPSGTLPSAGTVTVPLMKAVDPTKTAIVVATAEGDGPISVLKGTVTSDRRHATFQTSHFSLFGIRGIDLGAAWKQFKQNFVDPLSGGFLAEAAKPSCADEAGARQDGYQISSTSGNAIYWCFGRRGNDRLLTIVNNRRYSVMVTHPGLAADKLPHVGWDLTQLHRAFSGGKTILPPRESATFKVTAARGTVAGVTSEFDEFAENFYAFQTGVESLIDILTRFGKSELKEAQAIADLLDDGACVDAILSGGPGKVLSSCFSAEEIYRVFGSVAALLLLPLIIFGPLIEFFHSELNALFDVVNHRDRYTVGIRQSSASTPAPTTAPPPTLQPAPTTAQPGPTSARPVPTPAPPAPTRPSSPPPTTKKPAPPTTPAQHAVKPYNNWGPADAPGHAMCRGNPAVPRSMPGGAVAQTFTVPTGVATLSNALIQIDHGDVTVHLTVTVNGTTVATADAQAADDTNFTFAPAAVRAGDAVTLSLSFTATAGKITTVYTAGSPGGSFTATNSCPDGAPNFSSSTTGLRAVVSGMSA